MNIALMTCNDDNYEALARLTAPTKKAYCDRWGFTFEHLTFPNGREQCWEKAKLTKEMLEKYDALIYMDTDAFVANQEFDIRPYIEKHDLMFSTDLNGINAGVYVVKSTPLTKQLWFCVSMWGPMFFNYHPWKDQECLKHYLANPPYDKLATYMPQNFMNSYIHELYVNTPHPFPDYIQGNYKEGDWAVHLPGIPTHIRFEVLQNRFGLE